jgi:hypothetical protein
MGRLPLERSGDFVVRCLALERDRSSPEGYQSWPLDRPLRLFELWALLSTGPRLRGL